MRRSHTYFKFHCKPTVVKWLNIGRKFLGIRSMGEREEIKRSLALKLKLRGDD